MHVGFINVTADRAKCSLLTASRLSAALAVGKRDAA